MGNQVTLGGDRLGSGNKQKVTLHGFERSNHDMSYLWRSTIAPGTIVPFCTELALPGDTFDIDLNVHANTHPTVGPLFGSMKLQLDVFLAPIRLYHSALHNNALGIGMKMQTIKFPTFDHLFARATTPGEIRAKTNNPSSLLSYLGYKGAGLMLSSEPLDARKFQALPLLAYWEIYKNYFSNKQEEKGYYIAVQNGFLLPNVTDAKFSYVSSDGTLVTIPVGFDTPYAPFPVRGTFTITSDFATDDMASVMVEFESGIRVNLIELWENNYSVTPDGLGKFIFSGGISTKYATEKFNLYNYATASDVVNRPPTIHSFPLTNIDKMRELILASAPTAQFSLNDSGGLQPYDCSYTYIAPGGGLEYFGSQFTQQGLGLKTYQSDLFNNWLNTEWITGVGGINDITKVDTSAGYFNIDSLNLAKKVYDMLNRIAVSGGTYDDWLNAVYDHTPYGKPESPVYCGGLSKEIVFQEVVANSSSEGGAKPLGTLAGRGTLSSKHKGGKVVIKVNEPAYIIGVVSITPRIDYSQGNKWDTSLLTMDDLHKPNLDEIGFQDLIGEQMGWWSTNKALGSYDLIKQTPGKQPAWINYMTNVNQVHGNFAIEENEMFMVLNRRYEPTVVAEVGSIKDVTTYIDPTKYNQIFAQTSIDAQNFWIQISVDMFARRKMSAKVMPNL